jgi:hypothetical protein
MKMKPIFVGAVLALSAFVANAAELTLFGETVSTVHRDEMRTAAKTNGARLIKSSGTSDVFDASRMGLPGAQTLEIVYLDGQLVMAQYALEKDSPTDEKLRKMLVSKYAYPTGGTPDPWAKTPRKFDDEYVGEGKYRWKFDNDMELVYTKEFFGERFLTYANKTAQAKMQRLLDSADKSGVSQAAKAKSNLF